MELEERENEIILEKLERMEDFLKSFIAGLGETSEKKGRRIAVTVEIPDDGKILKWFAENNKKVWEGDLLCKIKWGSIVFSGITEVRAPTTGYLDIEIGVGGRISAFKNTTIAYIEQETAIPI